MHRLILLLLVTAFSSVCYSQITSTVHIVTQKGNYLPSFPNYHFQVNGQSYKLKAGECMDITVQADSIHVIVLDKRWVKNGTDELHVPAAKNVNVWVRVIWKGNYKNPRYGAEICACYEELKKKCK